jgi:alpha-L-arabinofuranosidase
MAALLILAGPSPGDDASITVDASKTGPPVAPSMYGIFFEEINHGAEGGLYAEMIQNRSFEETLPVEGCTLEGTVNVAPPRPHHQSGKPGKFRIDRKFPSPWPAWSLEAKVGAARLSLETASPVHPRNVNYLRIAVDEPGPDLRLLNDGFWGIAVKQGEKVNLTFHARGAAGPVTVGLQSRDGRVLASAEVAGIAPDAWKKHAAVLVPSATDPAAKFFLQPRGKGVLDLDVVSLMPEKTFRARPNGLRADIAQLLADMKPAFMRFPGGCYVEGATWENRYRWKETIGPIEERPGHWCLWNYRSTDGMGYHEFLQLCEDIGCDAMYVANAGLACEFRHGDALPEDRLDEQIQDTLDALEYALGAATSKWGALRAKHGHPGPFPLKYLEIGNENHGALYRRNYNRIAKAVKAAWPQVRCILNCGTGDWNPVHGQGVDRVEIADEHFYRNPAWMFDNFRRYDRVPRDRGFEVYVGEYACNQQVGRGNLLAALSEASFMLGMERNGDVVTMTSYAPLFFNVNRLDWPVNMIGFNSASSFGRTSYHVQKLFSLHRPDANLATDFEVKVPAETGAKFSGFVGLGTWNGAAEYKDLRIEKDGKVLYASDFASSAAGWKPCGGKWGVEGGAYRQSEPGERKIAFYEGARFDEYTLTLKARKLSGEEGFLVQFGAADRDHYHQFNLGGWGNRAHAFERIQAGRQQTITPETPGKIEPGRWYEIRLAVRRNGADGFLDGKRVASIAGASGVRFYAAAGIDRKAGEIVLKVVNGEERPMTATIDLKNVSVEAAAKVITLAGNPKEENDVDAPERIIPREEAFPGAKPSFAMEFKPSSFTILRIKTR